MEIELGAEPFEGTALRVLLDEQLRELPAAHLCTDGHLAALGHRRGGYERGSPERAPRDASSPSSRSTTPTSRCSSSTTDGGPRAALIHSSIWRRSRASKILTEERPGASAARNTGMRAASGAIVAFTDDDAVVDPGWLRELATAMVIHDAACVTGLVVPAELETPAQIWFEEYGGFGKGYRTVVHEIARAPRHSPLFPYAAGMFGSGNNVAFAKDALSAVGGFNERLGPGTPTKSGEDLALFIAILSEGGRLVYEPSAIVHHSHRRTYEELRTQVHDYGLGLTAMLASLVDSDPRHLLAITRRLPHGARLLFAPGSEKNAQHRAGYPRELALMEVAGMLKGPRAYLSARRAARRTIRRR